MEYTNKITRELKAKFKKNEPLFTAFAELREVSDKENGIRGNDLLFEINGHIFKKSKRLLFQSKIVENDKIGGRELEGNGTFGLNQNGLGIMTSWGEQIETLGGERRYNKDQDKKIFKWIITNDVNSKEIAKALSKENKRVMKKLKTFYKKNGIDALEKERHNDIRFDKFVIQINESGQVDLSDSGLRKLESTINYDRTFCEKSPEILGNGEVEDIDLTLKDVRFMLFLFENSVRIRREIKLNIAQAERRIKALEVETKFLKGILEPFKVLESL